jgi:hypothetical protein
MRPSLSLAVVLGALLLLHPATAQTVVNSTFVGQFFDPYSDPNNWAPAEVPNNTGTRSYNVTVPGPQGPVVDIDATISNLTSQARVFVDGHTLTVTGTTSPFVDEEPDIIVFSSADAPATFNAGTLAAFSNNTLRGRYTLYGMESPATLKFKGANVGTLSDGELILFGALTQVVDEFGNDALDGLTLVESSASLVLDGRNLTAFEPFTNQGILTVGQGSQSTIFTAANSLTNFDAATRTLRGGEFKVGAGFEPEAILPVELRFSGADIVNNGSKLALSGAGARIADLAGNDGLRNLARNLPGASLTFHKHNVLTTTFRNDGSLSIIESIFTVAGLLGNFDPSTRTLNGGAYEMVADGNLKFNGADIVHNGASIVLNFGGSITDLAGNNGLRNFSDNLAGAAFVVGLDQEFTTPPGDFTNAGRIEIIGFEGGIPEFPANSGKMTVPPGFSYTQTAGTTVINGTLTADRVNIFGGSLVSDIGTINGNITVTDAAVFPGSRPVVNGEVIFNSGSVYHTRIDVLGRVSGWRQIAGKVVVAGTLEVELPDPIFLGGSFYSFPILESDTSITGEFQNAQNGTRILTTDGRGSFEVVYEPNRVLLTRFVAVPRPVQLLNISTRAVLSASNDDPFHTRSVLIGGFLLTGTEAKTVALRGIGPSLSKFGLGPTLEDPVLELYASGILIASNDNWKATQENAITQNGLALGDEREAAMIVTLETRHSYTIILKEKNGRAGYGLVEVYDLSRNSFSKLGNISTRGFTDSNNVLIGGVIVGGDGEANDEVVVRAIGPTMRRGGVLNALDDPTLELRDGNGSLLAFNDDWGTNFDQIPNDYRPPEKTESALRASLPRGLYTAIVRAKPNSGGVGLVEFYDLWR